MPRRTICEVSKLVRHIPSLQSICTKNSELDIPFASVTQRYEADFSRGNRKALLCRKTLIGGHLSEEVPHGWSHGVLSNESSAPAKTGMKKTKKKIKRLCFVRVDRVVNNLLAYISCDV